MRFAPLFTAMLVAFSACVISPQGCALDLSRGAWTAFYDKSGTATVEAVCEVPDAAWVPIAVGSSWEEQKIDGWPIELEKREVVWYRCNFDGVGNLAGKVAVFFAGAIDDCDVVYLNGVKIGETGPDVPNSYRVARAYPVSKTLLRKSGNELLIKVVDDRGKGGVCGLPVAFYAREVYDEYYALRRAPNPFGLRMYTQEFSVVCADNDGAERLELEACPLLNDAQWAFSGRWDDNNVRHVEMKELMRTHGCRATFYLNSYTREEPFTIQKYVLATGPLLTQDGFSVGGHTLQHPDLSRVDKNQLFRQIAADRVYLEYAVGKPVNSFAFPGSDYGQSKTPEVRADIAEALIRAGYLHTVTSDFTREEIGNRSVQVQSVNIIEPGDENPDPVRFDSLLNWYTATDKLKATCPNLTVGIHVWHTPEGLEKLGQCLARYADRHDWWYCNQTEYAAYRYQYKASKLEKVKVVADRAFFRLSRPYGADVGEDVPLSLKVKNALIREVTQPAATHTDKVRGGTTIINVAHDPRMAVPAIIDMHENRGNLPEAHAPMTSKLPGVQFFIRVDEKAGLIHFTGRNDSAYACAGVSLLSRVPLRYEESGRRVEFGTLNSAATRSETIPLGGQRDGKDYREGNPYYIVQADFSYNGQPVRVFATALVLNSPETAAGK